MGYRNTNYRGGGNLGFGYYDAFENRNTQPISVPTGYRGYNWKLNNIAVQFGSW